MDPGKLPMREMLIVTEYPRTLDQVYKTSLVLERLSFEKKRTTVTQSVEFCNYKNHNPRSNPTFYQIKTQIPRYFCLSYLTRKA